MEDNVVTVLIVDDDANVRKTFGNILKLKGSQVEGAGTGAEAIDCAKKIFFNIAVIDMKLPDMSGFDVLREVVKISANTIPLMITAYASMDSAIESMNRGAYSYVTKPVNMDEVLAVLGRALEKQRLSMENNLLMRELKAANEKLKELDLLKSEFVAMVSHELKNPLCVIKGVMELLIDGTIGAISPKQKELVGNGKRSAERLLRLVTNLLDIAKIEAGKMELLRESISPEDLIREVLTSYKSMLAEKELSVKEEIQRSEKRIWADPDKVTEVIINLLNNAIKYTPKGGNITVKLDWVGGEVRFEIADTGPGIPEKAKEKIFDKFERITAETQEGTGLGLPIAKNIVELHKGKIWVESEHGQGSRFIFTIPQDLRA